MGNNKNIIIMALIVMFSVNIKAQNFKHYPLSEVKDTAQYLYLNFIKQKDYFVGKPFAEVVKIYKQDLPLSYFSYFSYFSYSTTSPYIAPNGKEYIDGAELYWLETPRWDYLFDNYYSELTFFNVEFKPPYTVEEDTYVNSLPSKNLTTDDEANGLKDFIIKDIDISGKGIMNIDCEDVILNAGDCMRVDPSTKRELRAADDSAISYICIQAKAASLDKFTAKDGVIV